MPSNEATRICGMFTATPAAFRLTCRTCGVKVSRSPKSFDLTRCEDPVTSPSFKSECSSPMCTRSDSAELTKIYPVVGGIWLSSLLR